MVGTAPHDKMGKTADIIEPRGTTLENTAPDSLSEAAESRMNSWCTDGKAQPDNTANM